MRLFIPLPVRVPSLLKRWYPSWYVWDRKSEDKCIYLTFDDGPVPEVTPWVLDMLSRKQIKASFFCIGDNVAKHPAIFQRLITEGHSVGNHTLNHLKGWLHDTSTYVENTLKAEAQMSDCQEGPSSTRSPQFPLFRPPYGKIKRKQAKALRKLGYQIVMYRVVAYDWEAKVSPEKCLENVIKNTKSGDLVVFHDSVKAQKNMQYALPKMISHFQERGYRFEKL